MGLMDTILGGLGGETRAAAPSGLSRPASWLVDFLGGGSETYAGKSVTPMSALSLVPVFSAVTLLAGAVGSTPLLVYRRLDGDGRERAYTHRTWKLLHEQPNEFMAADEFWEIVTAHVLLWGNAFVVKGRGPNGLVNELIPLRPDRTFVMDDKNGRPVYVYLDKQGREVKGGADEVLHFRGLGVDGKVGLSPIQLARQTLGNQLAQTEFQGRFWSNNARPGGVLKHPNELSTKAQKRLRATWDTLQGGLANAGKTAILEEGMEWQALGLPLADAQFIEQARFGRSDVALLFRVPARMLLADAGGSMTYSNVESDSLDFVKWSLRRWLKRHEGTLKRDPDLFLQGARFYPEFLLDDLLRADSETRSRVYQRALNPTTGWLDVDEVRAMENRNPLTPEQRRAREALAKAKARPAAPAPAAKDEPDEPDNGGQNDGGDDAPQGGEDQ